jgi:AcrR family transcriptional regulator
MADAAVTGIDELEMQRRAERAQVESNRILCAAHREVRAELAGGQTKALSRLTIERVALASGVGKPTIYRTWANAHELAMAAFLAGPQVEFARPRTRSARKALAAHLAAVIVAFSSIRGRQITLTMASADPESELAKAFRNQVILKSRDVGRGLLLQGGQSGELRPIADIDTVLDMIYGPLFYRLLAGHLPLQPAFAQRIVDTLCEGIVAVAGGGEHR